MRGRKRWSVAFSLIFLMTILVACGTQAQPSSSLPESDNSASETANSGTDSNPTAAANQVEKVTIRLAHQFNTAALRHEIAQKFADLASERSGGNIKVEIYPSGQLATNATDAFKGVSSGTIDMTIEATVWLTGFVKDFNVLDAPYLFKDKTELIKVAKEEPVQEMFDTLEKEFHIKVINSDYARGPRLVWTKEPIEKPEDFKDVKMRIPSAPLFQETYKSFGVSQMVAIPITEAYQALAQGIADGTEGPLDTIYSAKLHEILQYGNRITPMSTGGLIIFAINEAKWSSLSEQAQEILLESATETAAYANERDEAVDKELEHTMQQEGVTFVDIDQSPFIELTSHVPAKMEEAGIWSKGLYEEIKGFLQ